MLKESKLVSLLLYAHHGTCHLVTLRLTRTKNNLLFSYYFYIHCFTDCISEPPEDGLIIEHDEDNNTVSCYANGLFPAPELKICVIDV